MYVVVWEYTVRPGAGAEFERLYGPDGEWATLFRGAPGYLGTELLRDAAEPGRYLTVDRWRSAADCAGFHQEAAAAYAEVDRAGEALTLAERRVGEFEGAAE